MIGGSYYYQDKREDEKALRIEAEGKKAKERQNAWIRELEEREREDKEVSTILGEGTGIQDWGAHCAPVVR